MAFAPLYGPVHTRSLKPGSDHDFTSRLDPRLPGDASALRYHPSPDTWRELIEICAIASLAAGDCSSSYARARLVM